MGLREYQRKRDFERTAEPAGKPGSNGGHSYCIQKHAASHLHYDFRLELDGVLKSWAVPKGPSRDPSVKRLAMHVEDRPVQYGSFEGTIPKGQYGGGTVMLWDRGEWEPLGDAAKDYKAGRLKFQLHGEKLHGAWMLLRTGKGSEKDERRWLLFKERDDEAMPTAKGDILEKMPLSASTGRDLDEIAQGKKATGSFRSTAAGERLGAKGKRNGKPAGSQSRSPKVTGEKEIDVQLATLVSEAPPGDEWLHEIKYDGYRMVCRIAKGTATFLSRNHHDWTDRLASLAGQAAKIRVQRAVFDGEVVVVRPDGVTHFQDLQNAFQEHRTDGLRYVVFDVLELDGDDLRSKPLVERKELLRKLLTRRGTPVAIQYSEHVEGNGPAFYRECEKRGLEGIICKRAESPYRGGRGTDWLKVKCLKQEEFVIGGYTDPDGSRTGFGAILVGFHDVKGELTYAGKVGTGFDDNALRTLGKRFVPLEQKASPFADRKKAPSGTHWLKPTLVAQIRYGSRTDEGILRHASFQGLREDKAAEDVVAEKPKKLANIEKPRRAGGVKVTRQADVPRSSGQYDKAHETYAGIRLTSPDKVIYPEAGLTKLDLARYYEATAEWLLPHLADRPVVLVRCPDGMAGECFYQKHPGQGTPDNLKRVKIRQKTSVEEYVIVEDVAGLISLTQIGALEIHAWGSRRDKVDYPDQLIFDLDPDPSVVWKKIVECGKQVRDFLQELGLESFVKLTGGKGLHVVVPIERRHDWKAAKAFCKLVADVIVAADPKTYTANMSKAVRSGKIFLDYLRNDRGSTAVVPYSPRAKPNASVAVPIAWSELTARTSPDHFTIASLAKRLAKTADPWADMANVRQSLTGPIKKLKELADANGVE